MPFLKSLSISDEVLGKFGVRCTPEYQRVTSKGSGTVGSEWPDKRDTTGFGSVARGGGDFFFAWSSSPNWQCWFWGGLSNGTVLPMVLYRPIFHHYAFTMEYSYTTVCCQVAVLLVRPNLDSFTVSSHSPNDRTLSAVSVVQGNCHWQTMEIPAGYVIP